MSDIRKLLDILNETSAGATSSGSVATVAQEMSVPLKRVTQQKKEEKTPEVIEYGMWENSAYKTSESLKKNRDRGAKIVKSIYGEDTVEEDGSSKQQAAIAIAKKKKVSEGYGSHPDDELSYNERYKLSREIESPVSKTPPLVDKIATYIDKHEPELFKRYGVEFINDKIQEITKTPGIPGDIHTLVLMLKEKLSNEEVMEGYILKKTNVEKTFEPGDPDEYYTSGGADVTTKHTDYEIINNKTGKVVGTASWTTNDYFGPGALKITMKNGATRWLDIWEREKGNPQTAFNRFVKDPKTAKKYKDQEVAEGSDNYDINSEWMSKRYAEVALEKNPNFTIKDKDEILKIAYEYAKEHAPGFVDQIWKPKAVLKAYFYMQNRNKPQGELNPDVKLKVKQQMLKVYGPGKVTFTYHNYHNYVQHEDKFGDTNSNEFDPKTGKVKFDGGSVSSTYYGEGVAEGTKTGNPVILKGCDFEDVVNWLVKNVGPVTKKSPNYYNGWEGRDWILHSLESSNEDGIPNLELSANTKLTNNQVLAKTIQMACSNQQGVAEGSYEETEETAVINMFEKLVKQGRDPIDMIAHKFGWGSRELDQLAKNLGFKNSVGWANAVKQGKGVNEEVAEGFSDVVKGIKRVVKGKEHPDVVASKHAGRAMGHYNQGDISAGDKETKRYVKTRDMHLKAKGVTEDSGNKVHLKTPKHGLADHPGRNTGVGLRTFSQTPEQDRCPKCNSLFKNHYKQGVAKGSDNINEFGVDFNDIKRGDKIVIEPDPHTGRRSSFIVLSKGRFPNGMLAIKIKDKEGYSLVNFLEVEKVHKATKQGVAEGLQKFNLKLESIEKQFGEIKLSGGIVNNNQSLIKYLAKHSISTDVFDHLVEQKIGKVMKDKRITESIDKKDTTLNRIFSDFNDFSTGNKVKVGDSVAVLNLEALSLSTNSIELSGFLKPETITHVDNDYVEFESGKTFPKQKIIQLRMWRQVIFFHDVEQAKKCLTAMSLHAGNIGDWKFSINVNQKISELKDKTLKSYQEKVSADAMKHPADPTKRSPEKANRSVAGFAKAQKRLDKNTNEGRFIKGPGGVPLDRHGNPKLPKPPVIKAPSMSTTVAPKLSLDAVWRKVEEVVGQVFPDGDPIDWLIPWFKKHGIRDLDVGDILRRAAKKNGYEDLYDYYDSMKDQYDRDMMAEGWMGDDEPVSWEKGGTKTPTGALGSEQDDPFRGVTPPQGKTAARNAHRLGKTYTNPHSPKYHKKDHAAWEQDYNSEMTRLKNKGVAEGSEEGNYPNNELSRAQTYFQKHGDADMGFEDIVDMMTDAGFSEKIATEIALDAGRVDKDVTEGKKRIKK